MDGLKRRNPPFAPKTEKGDAEIRRSPYGGPDVSGGFGDDMRLTEKSFPGADLFGMAISPSKRSNSKPETAALLEVLKALRAHPAIAWRERMNSGVARIGARFVRSGWPGCPDVLGQLKDGRLLGVEVKGSTGKLRQEQAVFLDCVRGAGGVAVMARDCRDVFRELEKGNQ